MPPAPTVPRAPELASAVPPRSAKARPPPTEIAPIATEVEKTSAVTSSVNVTLTWPTVPAEPTSTLPTTALALPSTEVTATAAPAAMAPIEAKMLYAVSRRSVSVVTSTPVTARAIVAVSSTWAFWLPWSLITATTAPAPTNPALPEKPITVESSSMSARTDTPPPALTVALPWMPASVLLRMFITCTAAPMPTNPAPIAPTTPTTSRESRAPTATLPPAVMVPSR